MISSNTISRRGFLRRTLAGGAGLALVGTPMWEAAANLLNKPQLINGVGLADPELVQLSINENPVGASPRAIEAVAREMFGINRYPFDNRLEEALSAHHGVDTDMVKLGVGSSEILFMVHLAAFYEQQGNLVTGYPSYPDLPRRAEQMGRPVNQVPLTPDFRLDLDGMARAIDAQTRMVTITNPNNPTGQILEPAALERFLRSVPKNVIACVDEAYIHFVDDPNYPSMISLTKELDNLLVVRTFSKAYGLGGMRVGYGIAKPALLERFARFTMGDSNKNTLSIAAAMAALKDRDHIEKTRRVVREGKQYLYKQLEEIGYPPIKTQTIFVVARVGANLQTLVDRLAERKIRVNKAFNMDGYMRISVGLPRENEAFIQGLRDIQTNI